MAFPLGSYNPPPLTFDVHPHDFTATRQAVWDMGFYLQQLESNNINYFQLIQNAFNNTAQGFGQDLVSAATISPTTIIHVVTGTATISTIKIPPGFNGALYLISRD